MAKLGTPSPDGYLAMARDASGALYAGGFTSGSLPGFSNARGPRASDEPDPVVAKYGLSGQLIWSKQWGKVGPDQVEAIAVDDAHNAVYALTKHGCGLAVRETSSLCAGV